MADVVELRNLIKRYGKVQAVRGLDLTVHEGDVYGFLGRNGAGKSTTIRMLMGITIPTSGTLRLFGEIVKGESLAARQKIGYVAQEQHFYGWMTPATLGSFVRGFYPTWDDAEYARLVRTLDLPRDRQIQTFSGGMQAKLALGVALAHRPPLLVLDEPTAGLDPVARREFLEMVRDQALHEGRTTLFSSHLIDEVERAASRVGIVEDGRMRYEGGLQELRDTVRLLRRPADAGPMPEIGIPVVSERIRDGEHHVMLQAPSKAAFDTLALPDGWSLETLHLEDIFLGLVSKRLVP